jgi:hypothetical protein
VVLARRARPVPLEARSLSGWIVTRVFLTGRGREAVTELLAAQLAAGDRIRLAFVEFLFRDWAAEYGDA